MEVSVCDLCCPPNPVEYLTNASAWGVYTQGMDAIAADDVQQLAALLPSRTMHNCDFAMWPTQKQLLHWAAEQGAGHCLEYLLALLPRDACDSPNNKRATPLHVAAYYGQVGAVEALLAAGADAVIRNRQHETPCEAAVAGERNYRSPEAFAHAVACLREAGGEEAPGSTAGGRAGPAVALGA
jgi:ankyrin repeat protein